MCGVGGKNADAGATRSGCPADNTSVAFRLWKVLGVYDKSVTLLIVGCPTCSPSYITQEEIWASEQIKVWLAGARKVWRHVVAAPGRRQGSADPGVLLLTSSLCTVHSRSEQWTLRPLGSCCCYQGYCRASPGSVLAGLLLTLTPTLFLACLSQAALCTALAIPLGFVPSRIAAWFCGN